MAWLLGSSGFALTEIGTCHSRDYRYRPQAGHVLHRCGLELTPSTSTPPAAPQPEAPRAPAPSTARVPVPSQAVARPQTPRGPRGAWPRYAGEIPHIAPYLALAMETLDAAQRARNEAQTVRTFIDPVSGLRSTLAIDRRDREREVSCPYCEDKGFIFVEEDGGLVRTGFLCSCAAREVFRIGDTDKFRMKTFEQQFGIYPEMRERVGAQQAPEPPDAPPTRAPRAPGDDNGTSGDCTDRGLSPVAVRRGQDVETF